MSRSKRIKTAVFKLYAAAAQKAGSPDFYMSTEDMRKRLSRIYGVNISVKDLDRRLSQYEKESYIKKL